MAEVLQKNERKGFWRNLPKGSCSVALTFLSLVGIQADTDYAEEISMVRKDSAVLEGQNFRVMTANVHGWRGSDGTDNLNDLLSAIMTYKVDVACLQEVDIKRGHLQTLHSTGFNVLYAETEQEGFGNAVISKTDLKLQQNFNLPPSEKIRQRGALLVQVATLTGDIELLATHVTTRRLYQHGQFGKLGQIARKRRADIVCGDLNEELETIAKTTLGEYFSSSVFANHLEVYTFPAKAPIRKIDFVLSHCYEIEQPIISDINSDHLAVIHQFTIDGCK